ncbi:Domain amino terminal to FKBP-type peptidyl-prolyl isomerase [Parasphingorhabdus marina DSM 22363]|uniref:Peptidyl-prolyl cis-trans isomerase n=1 Tax=Parasphingorhabdus marina DSM 22363 TaxID=1123272 RepID=A0A1N6CV88_9SPHN|nr:FKBP-type peptidyl-prolyl cis-trans isomerase [Parasphingorhabdus marina]SIN62422.1 Domain amino terminal to FKBP-type peptidyl-prolyl isomerase [Parasphingorhabdus marina DSM 22363]
MSVTTVPIRPIEKGTLTKMWIGIALVVLIGAALAWFGTREAVENGATDEQFLAMNADKDGVETTTSGLQIQTIKAGEGPNPVATDIARVVYTGTLRDGTEFDTSIGRGQPEDAAVFPVGGVVPGFSEALQKMQKGGEYRIWIPAELGYGEISPGPEIPANSLLIFDVTLVDFISQQQMQMLQQQMQQREGALPPGR